MSKTEQEEGVLSWRKSSYSIANGQCVEVGIVPGTIIVRDSVSPAEGQLRFAAGAWQDFIDRVKDA